MAEALGADERREIDRLRRALELRKGPEFHVIVGDTARVMDAALAEVLPDLLPDLEVSHVSVGSEEGPKSFAVRWMQRLEAAIHDGGTQPLILSAWDDDPEHVEHWGWIFARLNERRNEIMRGLGRPLLLLVSPDNERLLGHMGPDLWSIRGVGMRLRDRSRAAVTRDAKEAARTFEARPPTTEELTGRQQRVNRARGDSPSIAHAVEALRLSRRLHESKHDVEALASAEEAIEQYEALTRQDDDMLIDLARALRAHAEIAAGIGQVELALDDLQRATSIITGLIRQSPDRLDYLQDLRACYEALGELYDRSGHGRRAVQFYGQAEAVGERLAAVGPAPPFSKRVSQHEHDPRAMEQRVARELVDVLARLMSAPEDARRVATRSGVPPEHLPSFETARRFWTDVVEQAIKGRFELRALAREAFRRFPHDAELRKLDDILATLGKHVPSVFIAYHHDSSDHEQRVIALADRLRDDGVDVRLDHYAPLPAKGWTWTTKQLADVDCVAVVWTGELRGDVQHGVTGLQDVVHQAMTNNKVVLPVRFAEDPEGVPAFLRLRTSYLLPDDYDELLRRIMLRTVPPRG